MKLYEFTLLYSSALPCRSCDRGFMTNDHSATYSAIEACLNQGTDVPSFCFFLGLKHSERHEPLYWLMQETRTAPYVSILALPVLSRLTWCDVLISESIETA